jgi:hypothetical protein
MVASEVCEIAKTRLENVSVTTWSTRTEYVLFHSCYKLSVNMYVFTQRSQMLQGARFIESPHENARNGLLNNFLKEVVQKRLYCCVICVGGLLCPFCTNKFKSTFKISKLRKR